MFRAALAAVFAALALAACGSVGAVDVEPGGGEQSAGGSTYLDPRELMGKAEDELAGDVRVGRRGDEHFMLTEDYVVGRHTVELDADAEGVYRVTSVVTEHPDGPATTR